MEQNNTIEPICKEAFLPQVIQFKMEKWRLAQLCAVRVEGGYELSYSFAKDYQLRTLRVTLTDEEKVPSITQMYPCAFLQENEMAELFGVQVENIEGDYHGKLYRIARETPFKEKG